MSEISINANKPCIDDCTSYTYAYINTYIHVCMYDIHTITYRNMSYIHIYIYACRVYEVLRRAAVLLKLGSTNRKPGHSASPIGSLVKPPLHECTMQNWSKLYVYIFVYLFN